MFTHKEIEVLQQLVLNEQIKTSQRINELKRRKENILGLEVYKVVIEEKIGYHQFLDDLEIKLRDIRQEMEKSS